MPEPDELTVAWGGAKTLVIVGGCHTRTQVAEALRTLADAYEEAAQ
jgi:hypothetical protein